MSLYCSIKSAIFINKTTKRREKGRVFTFQHIVPSFVHPMFLGLTSDPLLSADTYFVYEELLTKKCNSLMDENL